MKPKVSAFTLSVVMLCTGLSVEVLAEQLIFFDFNDMGQLNNGQTRVTVDRVVGVPTLTLAGGSYKDPNGQRGIGYTDGQGNHYSAGQAGAWSSGVNDTQPKNTFTLAFDGTGQNGFRVRFDCRSLKSGPSRLTLTYRVGEGELVVVGSQKLAQGKKFELVTRDLSGIKAINNTPGIELRWTWSGDGTGGGTARIDNLELTGSSIVGLRE